MYTSPTDKAPDISLPEFYTQATTSESERLKIMSAVADPVSLRAINKVAARLSLEPNEKLAVVDVGCGASTSLGRAVKSFGEYIPVDGNPEFVSEQQKAGFPAVESYADKLALGDSVAEVVHARFVMAWLDEQTRKQTLSEMMRISKDSASVVIMDYDWSVVSGPKELEDAVACVVGILEARGFDAKYGSRVKSDVTSHVSELFVALDRINISEERYSVLPTTMREAKAFIDVTAEAVMADLYKFNLMDEYNLLRQHLDKVDMAAKLYPEAPTVLPDITVLSIEFDKKPSSHVENKQAFDRFLSVGGKSVELGTFRESEDYELAIAGVYNLERVFMAQSPRLIQAARQARAYAYCNSRKPVVTDEAIDVATGTLKSHIEPGEQVDRTVYVVSKRDGYIGGGAGIIEPDKYGQNSIPTIARIENDTPEVYRELRGLISPDEEVCEFTGVYITPKHGKLEDVVGPIIALAEIAYRKGYDKAVMGLADFHVELFEALFGKEAVKRLSTAGGRHHINLDGVRDDVSFITFVVDIKECMRQANKHADDHKSGKPILEYIADTTADIISRR